MRKTRGMLAEKSKGPKTFKDWLDEVCYFRGTRVSPCAPPFLPILALSWMATPTGTLQCTSLAYSLEALLQLTWPR